MAAKYELRQHTLRNPQFFCRFRNSDLLFFPLFLETKEFLKLGK